VNGLEVGEFCQLLLEGISLFRRIFLIFTKKYDNVFMAFAVNWLS
jgi:hypothetical protein